MGQRKQIDAMLKKFQTIPDRLDDLEERVENLERDVDPESFKVD